MLAVMLDMGNETVSIIWQDSIHLIVNTTLNKCLSSIYNFIQVHTDFHVLIGSVLLCLVGCFDVRRLSM